MAINATSPRANSTWTHEGECGNKELTLKHQTEIADDASKHEAQLYLHTIESIPANAHLRCR